MRASADRRLGLGWLILAGFLFGTLPCLGQPTVSNAYRTETHAIRRITYDVLREDDREPEILRSMNEAVREPSRTLIVLMGDVRGWNGLSYFVDRDSLAEFIAEGGAVLIATDAPTESLALTTLTGYFVDGRQVVAGEDTDAAYVYERDECPVVVADPNSPEKRLFLPLLRNGVETVPLRLATNRSSFLMRARRFRTSGEAFVLASFPDNCLYGGHRARGQPFAATCEHGAGRLLLLADSSAFINEMMFLRPDAGNEIHNVQFAYRAITWLRGEDERRRDRVLFVLDGKVQSKLNVPLYVEKIDVVPLQRRITRALNRFVMRTQEEHFEEEGGEEVNEALIDGLGDYFDELYDLRDPRTSFYLTMLLLVTILLALRGFHRLKGASYNLDVKLPLLRKAVRDAQPQHKALLQRRAMLVESNNLAAYARQLARECLQTLSVPGKPSGVAPRVEATGGWWERYRLKQLANAAWALAYAAELPSVGKKTFRRLPARLRFLEQAVRSGRVRYVERAAQPS